jgi:hypothetical protein
MSCDMQDPSCACRQANSGAFLALNTVLANGSSCLAQTQTRILYLGFRSLQYHPPGHHKHWVGPCQHLLHKSLNVGCIEAAHKLYHSTAQHSTAHRGMAKNGPTRWARTITQADCMLLHHAAQARGGDCNVGPMVAVLHKSQAFPVHIASHEPMKCPPPGSM